MGSNYFPLFMLLKPTYGFFFNFSRLWRLTAIPATIIFLIASVSYIFPILTLTETAEVGFNLNVWLLLSVLFVCFYVWSSVMLRVQQIIFFGDEDGYFTLLPTKKWLKYILSFFKIFFESLFCSIAVALLFIFLFKKFLDAPVDNALFVYLGAFLLLPYFSIRFSLLMPACAANDENSGLKEAWRMTERSGVFLTLYYILALIVPLVLFMPFLVLYGYFQPTFFLFQICFNFLSLFSCLLSGIGLAAFTAYLYPVAKDRL